MGILREPVRTPEPGPLVERARRTLEIMHRWGYSPTVEMLARDLVGGPVPVEDAWDSLEGSDSIIEIDGFVCLQGHESLVGRSRERERLNRLANGRARAIATTFARDLVRNCPFVECVALSGSVASGGYVPMDDIDFDVFVKDGTKYLTYAASLALGFLFVLRRPPGTPFRKVICINVLWTRGQRIPFQRRDVDLAFELLRCRPLIGSEAFREVLRENEWISSFFPQVGTEDTVDAERPWPSVLGRALGWIAERPRLLAVAERLGRALSFMAYQIAHWNRRNDAEAMDRLAFLQRVKYPYEVFQD